MNDTTLQPGVNSHQFWEDYMATKWDTNRGRDQTRLFAKYFLDAVELPADARTLLDVSCAKGDALPVFLARYPTLQLFGADISQIAIEEARRSYGQIAQFDVAGFEDLSRKYDIIVCSNTLEHFENYLEMAELLLAHCDWLYILVPYLELRNGKRLSPAPGEQHVATFDEHSFDPLVERGVAADIRSWVRYTPGAWGPGRGRRLMRKAKAFLRCRAMPLDLRQIFFQVRSAVTRAEVVGPK